MLRAIVVILVVANLAFYAWSLGWLDGVVGVRARGDHEPERLARQVRPETVVVLSAAASDATVGNVPAGAAACLEVGPFGSGDVGAAENALQAAGIGSNLWTDLRSEQPAAWLVYMGGFADRETRQRKQEEIRRVRVEAIEITVPGEGAFGLSLGRYDDRAEAEKGLAQAAQRGIRTARVVQAAPPATLHTLRIERADAALAARLAALNADALGKGFAACVRAEGGR